MENIRIRYCRIVLPGMLVVFGVTACSQPAAIDQNPSPSQRAFSAEDKIIARKLSIGSDPALAGGSDDPYEQNLQCEIAMGNLVAQLNEVGFLDASQKAAMKSVFTIYERRIWSLAQRAGKSEADVARDRDRIGEMLSDRQTSGRIALSCVRKLQSEA